MAVTINASTSTGLVQSADTSGEIELQSNGTTALKVNTNEGIQILNCLGVGNATPSTSGAGITFPATQSASTDANTLDDYEEGTWTPILRNATTTTYTTRNARYVKIGRVVYIQLNLRINSVGDGNTSQIAGLPFAASGETNNEANVGIANLDGSATNVVSIYAGVFNTFINITSLTTASAGFPSNPIFKNGTIIELGGWYLTTT